MLPFALDAGIQLTDAQVLEDRLVEVFASKSPLLS